MEAGRAIDTEIVAAAALLSAVLVVGLATVADYGLTVLTSAIPPT
jgi:hypothetical protein